MRKKIVIFSVILSGLIVVLFFTTSVWFHGITKKIFIPRIKTTSASASVNSIQELLNNQTPMNIALLGYGGGNHDGAYLTDSMIVVHIDPKTKKIFLISVPRDLWVNIPTNGTDGSYSKINAAYEMGLDDANYPNKQTQFTGADGGGRLAEYMVSQVTGLPVSYFVGMDFTGFTHTIDTLGGVDIDVEPGFNDYAYPIAGRETDTCGHTTDEIQTFTASPSAEQASWDFFSCRYEQLHFAAGLQHMDGTQALSYVRSRHSLEDGTDFGRAKRQRNLLVAVKAKIFSAGFIPQGIPFISSLGDDVRTDLSMDDVKTFLQNATVFNKYQITNLALTDQNYLVDTISTDGQDVLEPKEGIDNWTTIHNWISDQLSGKTEPVASIVQVENGTAIPGLAQLAVNRLKNENIHVVDPMNAGDSNTKQTAITLYDKNINPSDILILKKEFGVTDIAYATATQTEYNVRIIVGEDYNQLQGKKVLNEP